MLRLLLPDGASLAYDILGTEHIDEKQPIVLVGGLSSIRGDWERLAASLGKTRPVLIFDHRGIGDSTFSSPQKDDEITIESMARDMLQLLQSLRWPSISICGFSMGGVILQQLLFLPNATNPTPLGFQVTHVLLTGTMSEILRDRRYGVPINRKPRQGPLSENQKRDIVMPVLQALFDPQWLADNKDRSEWWIDRMIQGRPTSTILKQARAMNKFNFEPSYDKLQRDIKILVLHGQLDAVVPFAMGLRLLRCIPWATFVQVGQRPGQVPSLDFGHHWFEYFDVKVWHDVVEVFLGDSQIAARL